MSDEAGISGEEAHWEALARYFAGESSAREQAEMRAWLEAHPGEASALEALDGGTARLRAPAPSGRVDVASAWQRMSVRLDEADAPVVRDIGVARRSRFQSSPALRIAAAIALMSAATVLWTKSTREPVAPGPIAARTVITAPGVRDSLVLSDGTRVLLGPGSTFRIEEDYGRERRAVYLEGDALLEVRHDATRPFVLRAVAATIEDLGTTFAVHAVPPMGAAGNTGFAGVTSVTVTSGTVRLRGDAPADTGVVLAPGDAATAVAGVEIAVRRAQGAEDALAWTEGRLVFRDTPVPEVAATLERWYGIRIRLADARFNARTFTASLKNEAPADVMRMLALALDTRVDQQDSVFVIGANAAPGEQVR